MRQFIRDIDVLFDRGDYVPIIFVFLFMIIAAVLEMAGLAMLVPIIDIVSNPDKLQTNETYHYIYNVIGAETIQDFVIKFGVIIVGYILLKNLILGWIHMRQVKFLKTKEISLTNRLLASYMMKPYAEISARNSAELIRNINQEVNYLFNLVIGPILRVMAEIFVAIALLTLMILSSPGATLFAFGIVLIGGLIFIFGVRRWMKKFGSQRQKARGGMIEWATQSLQGLKELLVARKEKYFLDNFNSHAEKTKEAEIFDMIMGRIPQLFIETFAIFTMLSVMIFVFVSDSNLVATLSLFALVLVRMMPMMNRITVGVTRAKFYSPSLHVVADDLRGVTDMRNTAQKQLRKAQFKKSLSFENIEYKYPSTQKQILNQVSLNIEKGKVISIVGASGSGKTTLMDVMLGLLTPDAGTIFFDGKDVTNNPLKIKTCASYLPQSVYLLNATIAENIAFGVERSKINRTKIKKILKKVELEKMVADLPEGLETPIGDISKKISGGQQQRIGIARALYHEKDILFLDEATAGLDPKTEQTICQTLKSLTPEVTIISISHQEALINIADHIYTMKNGRLTKKK